MQSTRPTSHFFYEEFLWKARGEQRARKSGQEGQEKSTIIIFLFPREEEKISFLAKELSEMRVALEAEGSNFEDLLCAINRQMGRVNFELLLYDCTRGVGWLKLIPEKYLMMVSGTCTNLHMKIGVFSQA